MACESGSKHPTRSGLNGETLLALPLRSPAGSARVQTRLRNGAMMADMGNPKSQLILQLPVRVGSKPAPGTDRAYKTCDD